MKFRLISWIEWIESEEHEKLRNKAAQFKKKMHRILAWVRHPVSNSVSEGVNKNIQMFADKPVGSRMYGHSSA